MATYVYEDFRVTFTPRADDDYDVRAVDASGHLATGTFSVPLSADDLERTVLRLAEHGMTRRATPVPSAVRDIDGDDDRPMLDAERLGGTLAAALLAGDVGDAYRTAMQRAENHGHGTRLSLSLADAPALLSVPWEFLYDRPRFLASQRRTPIVRLLETGQMGPAPVIDGAVRILGIVASPHDLAPLDVAGEQRRINDALASVVATGQVQLDWLEPATTRSLRHALRDGNYHVVHYVGHSDFTVDGQGVIYLEDTDDGSAVAVDETLFANLLSDQNALRLVVLNSCEGARTTLTDPYAGVATTLVQLGVPAVVAMQFEISDRAAIVFAEELYANLIARRDPIDAAVAEARKAVYSDVDRVEWATPVLFVRDPDLLLFRFGTHAPEALEALEELANMPLPPPPPPWWRQLLTPKVLLPLALVAVVVIAGLVLRRCGADDDTGSTTTTTVRSTPSNATLGFPTVVVGDEGPVVRALQRLLVEQGEDVEVNGFFDDATEAAVERVEAAHNIPVDGTVGRVTWQQIGAPIRRGDRGPAVLGAEELLALLGADIVPDDQFTNATGAEVAAFQRANGLAVDSIVDIDTWRVMLAMVDRLPPDATVPTAPPSTAAA
jgi:peptidoglycan hydrolase-like protein with peptidoglycan-binding domain